MLPSTNFLGITLNNDTTSALAMVAAMLSALVTIGLAIYARRAWLAASETLKDQQRGVEISALAEHVRSLSQLAGIEFHSPGAEFLHSGTGPVNVSAIKFKLQRDYLDYRNELTRSVEQSAVVWQMHHHQERERMGPFREAIVMMVEAQEDQQDLWDTPRRERFMAKTKAFVLEFIKLCQDWQMDVGHRSSTVESVRKLNAAFTTSESGVSSER